MSYKPNVYIKAKEALEQRKTEAEKNQQMRRSVAITQCPELLSIEKDLASFSAEVIKCIGYGKDSTKQIESIAEKSLNAQKKKAEILKENGFPEDYLKTDYHCKICNDTGYHEGYMCSCYKELILETARKELCSTALLDESTFDKFNLNYYSNKVDTNINMSPRYHMTNVFNMCRKYANEFTRESKGLFFYGKTGLGKTHLSLAIADVAVRKGYNVIYTPVEKAMHQLEKEHFSRTNKDEESILEDFTSCDLLILDDLGAEFSTSFTVSQIYNIINSRLIDSKPTIISTNLGLEDIEKTYSQRVLSRIIGSLKPVYFFGEDIRQIKTF